MTPDNQPQGREWPCDHVYKVGENWHIKWAFDRQPYLKEIPDIWKVCPACLSKRPEEAKDALDEIFDKYLGYSDWSAESKKEFGTALRAWKDQCVKNQKAIEAIDNFMVRKEEPKKLEYLLFEQSKFYGMPLTGLQRKELANVCIEAVESIFDYESAFVAPNSGGGRALKNLRAKIRELL